MKRRLAILPLVAMAAFGLAACNSTTTGQGTAAPTGGGSPSTADGGSSPSSGSSGGGASLASVDPCSLVSSDEQSQLGLNQAQADSVPGGKPCDWTKPVDSNGENGYAVEIVVRDSEGLDQVLTQGRTVTSETIGSHQAKQLRLVAGGTCSVAIGVGDNARVDVTVTAGTDTDLACQVANELATKAEPQLPAGS